MKRSREAVSEKGEGGGEKNTLPPDPHFFRTQFRSLGVLLGTFVMLAEQQEKYFKFLKTWILLSLLRLKKENTFFTVRARNLVRVFLPSRGEMSFGFGGKKRQKQQKEIHKNKLRAGPRRK